MLRGLGQMKKFPVFFERERTLLTCCNYVSPSHLALTGYKMCHRQNVMKRLQFPCACKKLHYFLCNCCIRSIWSTRRNWDCELMSSQILYHWDMQMMRWIFIASATFLRNRKISSKCLHLNVSLFICLWLFRPKYEILVLLVPSAAHGKELHKSNC